MVTICEKEGTKTVTISAKEVFDLIFGEGSLPLRYKFLGWAITDGGKLEIIYKEE